jgi:predicted transcriptional regulator
LVKATLDCGKICDGLAKIALRSTDSDPICIGKIKRRIVMAESEGALRQLVAQVAAAYFSNSHVNPSEIPNVISQIAASLGGVNDGAGQTASEDASAAGPKLTRAQIRKSITPDALVSFEDNKPYKTLRRHLATRGLSPEQYREKWGLASDYPMVAPNYSAARSQLAKSLGLGQRGQQARRKGGGRGRRPRAEG